MTPDVVGRLTPEQIIALLDGGEPESSEALPASDRRRKARRDALDAVCVKFSLTAPQLLAQTVAVTRRQLMETRPEMRNVEEAQLIEALKEYGQ
jgi:hypothetical protein